MVEHLVRYHASTYEDEFRSVQRREGSLDAFVKGDEFSIPPLPPLDSIAHIHFA
ncbi:hypothetical protein JG688_00015546 [Phytophthora aleatoria]|uniref:Uncharacterized protein n=1 Tax=Phytophthora aleatoria TaxID=2496075 RepID=A0A8J5I5H1_9STRA|nr:hypothetical protein JG688_00015546 [Phytophthora aleatoria]